MTKCTISTVRTLEMCVIQLLKVYYLFIYLFTGYLTTSVALIAVTGRLLTE
jgi:Co/Zn/Cd efflux system component